MTGPFSSPSVVTERLTVAVSSSRMLAVALAVPIVTAALLGLLIVASIVSVPSSSASSRTVTLSVPVEAPSATLIWALAAMAV